MKEVGYGHYTSHTSDSLATALGLLPKVLADTCALLGLFWLPLLRRGSGLHMRKASEQQGSSNI